MLGTQKPVTARIRSRLSYANVVASLALLLALGGTATAAITLPNNSVGSPQIQTDAVGAREIATDAVRAAEIRTNAVGAAEIDTNAVGATEIEANAVGATEIEANAVRGPEIEANAVGGPEIEANAVGGPEIDTDAVGSPEIEEGAVRSSEILDDTIRLADIAPDAQAALDAPRVLVDDAGLQSVAECVSVLDCPNLARVALPAGSWLVQARFTINGNFELGTFCALVEDDADPLLDFAHNVGLGTVGFGGEQASLMAVVNTGIAGLTNVAVRCTEDGPQDLAVPRIVLTAMEVNAT